MSFSLPSFLQEVSKDLHKKWHVSLEKAKIVLNDEGNIVWSKNEATQESLCCLQ